MVMSRTRCVMCRASEEIAHDQRYSCAGWEVFGIKYAVSEPLSTVLSQVAEGSYQAVASLLWKLKRAEHSLSASWLALNSMQRAIGQVSATAKQHNIFLPGRHVLPAVATHGMRLPSARVLLERCGTPTADKT